MVGKQREKLSGVTEAALSRVASTAKTALLHSTEDRAHRGLQRCWLDCVPMPCLRQRAGYFLCLRPPDLEFTPYRLSL